MTSVEQKKINRNNRKRGGAFEKRVADYLGFEVVPYSGSNARFGYGDVRSDKWLIECKNIKPDCNKITIKRSWIDKNEQRAYEVDKKSAIAFMPSGKPNKFMLVRTCDINCTYKYEIVIEQKVHNTVNLIIHLDDDYIRDVKKGHVVLIRFKNDMFYIMNIEVFKGVISYDGKN